MAILDAAGDEPIALSRLDRIYLRNQQWKELADILGRQITIIGPDENKAAHVELKYRLGQLKEQHLDDVAGRDRRVPRHPRHRRRQPEGARLARDPPARRRQAEARSSRASSSRSTSSSRSGARSSASTRSSSRPRRTQLRRTSLLLRIGELQRTKLLDAEKAFDAYARAFREDPSTEAAKEQLEALAPLIEDGWDRLVKLFEGALEQARTSIRSSPTSSRRRSRAATRIGSATARRPSSSSRRRSRSRPTTSPRSRRSRRSSRATRSTPSCSRSIAGASTSRTSPTSASSSCSASAQIHEEMLERARRGDRDLQRDPRPGAR